MKQEGMAFFTDIDLTIVGMLLFFGVFMLTLFRVYFLSTAEDFETLSQLPLKNEDLV